MRLINQGMQQLRRIPMKKKDAELIQQTLDGDQSAFTVLVEKYQKGIHALVWQKIGDFHIAQEITQDAFLRAYQKLGSLKNHNLFSGWLYVIATRLCYEWIRKKRIPMQSLEAVDNTEVDKMAYKRHFEEEREADSNESRRELVRKLLKKLPESERTVMSLHYLGEMKCETISKFLGVSPNTVRSRLSRARNRLKKEEDLIRENLFSFQLPTQMTENIMTKISQINPTTPQITKPFLPWALSAASAMIVLFLMGIGTQNNLRTQEPYSLDTSSESTVEIVDAQIVLDSPLKQIVRKTIGSADLSSNSNGKGHSTDELLIAAAQVEETQMSNSKQQWVQTRGPEGGKVLGLFTTSRGDIFAGTEYGLYRLNDFDTEWIHVNPMNGPLQNTINEKIKWWDVVERHDTLYLANNGKILASKDRGETWVEVCESQNGQPIGMVITDGILEAQPNMTIYLAYSFGIFCSNDFGKTWKQLSEELNNNKISAIASIGNTVFVGTVKGLYRLKSGSWEKLAIGYDKNPNNSHNISDLIVTDNHLYVATKIPGGDLFDGKQKVFIEEIPKNDLPNWIEVKNMDGRGITWNLYHSTDLGITWKSITPEIRQEWNKLVLPANGILTFGGIRRVFASAEKVMVTDVGRHYYSVDAGDSWTSLTNKDNNTIFTVLVDGKGAKDNRMAVDINKHLKSLGNIDDIGDISSVLLLNANTLYRSGTAGIQRSTDNGKTWEHFNTGLVNTNVKQIYSINGILYANTETRLVYSKDGGESWYPVKGDTGFLTHIYEFNEELYVRDNASGVPRFLSSEYNNLRRIDDIPRLKETHSTVSNDSSVDRFEIVERGNRLHIKSFLGSFAVTDSGYYVEFEKKLFKWNYGDKNWIDTRVTEFDDATHIDIDSNLAYPNKFRFSISGKTVYVGKRGGQLLKSIDGGDNWQDVTEHLPFAVDYFNVIVFAGQTVYVSTNKGAMRSSNGTDWETLTDTEGIPIVVNSFAVNGTTVYGTVKQKVFNIRKESNTWQQVTPEIPHFVSCIEVDGKMLYVGTHGRGVLRYTLEE